MDWFIISGRQLIAACEYPGVISTQAIIHEIKHDPDDIH